MKLNENFRVSVVASGMSTELADTLSLAVAAARYDMAVSADNERLARLEGKIEKLEKAESLTEVEKLDLAKARLEVESLTEEVKALKALLSGSEDALEAVLESIEAEGNSRSCAENLLRVIALDGNQFLSKYALTTDELKDELVQTLTIIAEGTRWNKDGAPILGKDTRAAYKSALNHLRAVVEKSFSLKADSAFLKRTIVRPSGEELGLLVQTFVRDFTVKRKKGEDGTVSVQYEKVLRDWTSLRSQIVKIVLKRTMRAI